MFEIDMTPQLAWIDMVQTRRASSGADEGIAHAPFRSYTRAHLGRHSKTSSAPLLPQPVGENTLESLQDSGIDPSLLTSGINSNSREYQHGYIGRTGSIR